MPVHDDSSGDESDDALAEPAKDARLAERPGEPPVVARMIVEIRSDGTRTIARGAIEEVVSGERVAIEAHGSTPLALARSLAKSMFTAPMLARQAVRALIASKRRRSADEE
ncbi:MAG: hypothetical protein IPI67_08940 [Myxococcales bacterium]|nr:hypothetical protein [Myxococcales bacterium]